MSVVAIAVVVVVVVSVFECFFFLLGLLSWARHRTLSISLPRFCQPRPSGARGSSERGCRMVTSPCDSE
jgi:hypothetical protein